MSLAASNFYAQWQERNGTNNCLREGDAMPPESLLQAVWHHQRLLRDRLKTADGKVVRVLHPGFWNRGAGPDFHQAVIQIGQEIKTGDVEVDLSDSGWTNHGHNKNSNFKNVILHVVWDSRKQGVLPVLSLKNSLDAPLPEISSWVDSVPALSWPGELAGRCCIPLRQLTSENLTTLLTQAAQVRLERKARDFEQRARQAGWEQALWEGIFRALGYKQNVWPMRRIAEILPELRETKNSVQIWQARLLGVSGLLPEEYKLVGPEKTHGIKRKWISADTYCRSLWDVWWRDRNRFNEFILPKSIWNFSGLRPSNRPERRLALAAHWLASDTFLPNLERWFVTEIPARQNLSSLSQLLNVEHDVFWSHHSTFRSRSHLDRQSLIGEKRIIDLAINVILPWFWMRAVAGKNDSLKKIAESRYHAWPAGDDNGILRLARLRLMGKDKNGLFRTAAIQQGLLQIVRDFCQQSNAICTDCRFPALVHQWKDFKRTV